MKGNVAEEVSRIKQQAGQDILIARSGTLVRTLMRHDLIDEYRLLVYPVVVGSGECLFEDSNERLNLKLINARTFSSGLVALCYQRDRKQAHDSAYRPLRSHFLTRCSLNVIVVKLNC